MLEGDGEEIARATSSLRYAPNSSFTSHQHELGEEFLVLEGCTILVKTGHLHNL